MFPVLLPLLISPALPLNVPYAGSPSDISSIATECSQCWFPFRYLQHCHSMFPMLVPLLISPALPLNVPSAGSPSDISSTATQCSQCWFPFRYLQHCHWIFRVKMGRGMGRYLVVAVHTKMIKVKNFFFKKIVTMSDIHLINLFILCTISLKHMIIG